MYKEKKRRYRRAIIQKIKSRADNIKPSILCHFLSTKTFVTKLTLKVSSGHHSRASAFHLCSEMIENYSN